MVNNNHQCPRKEFAELLEKQNAENNGVPGSTLIKYSGNNLSSNIKNILFTDWLLLRIYFHHTTKCPDCLKKQPL